MNFEHFPVRLLLVCFCFYRFGGPIGGKGFIPTERDQSATLGVRIENGRCMVCDEQVGEPEDLEVSWYCFAGCHLVTCKTCNLCGVFLSNEEPSSFRSGQNTLNILL